MFAIFISSINYVKKSIYQHKIKYLKAQYILIHTRRNLMYISTNKKLCLFVAVGLTSCFSGEKAAEIQAITSAQSALPAGSVIIEAESLSLTGYRKEDHISASGGKLISLKGVPAKTVGTARFTYRGTPNTYDLYLDAYDENDGKSTLSVEQRFPA